MNRFIILLLMFVAAVQAKADDYGYLTFQTSNGAEQSLAVSNLKITISDGKLVATNGTTSQTFSLSDLSKMYFSSTATGIKGTTVTATDTSVDVYSTSGVRMGTYTSLNVAKANLKPGVYVVKETNKTYKITVK